MTSEPEVLERTSLDILYIRRKRQIVSSACFKPCLWVDGPVSSSPDITMYVRRVQDASFSRSFINALRTFVLLFNVDCSHCLDNFDGLVRGRTFFHLGSNTA